MLLCPISAFSQNNFSLGTLPAININHKLGGKWGGTINYQSRQVYRQGGYSHDIDSDNQFILSDFTVLLARKVGLNNKLNLGYLYRIRGSEIYQRTIQQFNIVRRYFGFRIAHRIATDQTFSDVEEIAYRLRYRLRVEIPLNGASVNDDEFYLKLSNEYLHAWQGGNSKLEGRLVGVVGYDFHKQLKAEAGLDFRAQPLTDSPQKHSYWGVINFYLIL